MLPGCSGSFVAYITPANMIYWFYNIKKAFVTSWNISENNENYDSGKCELLERNVRSHYTREISLRRPRLSCVPCHRNSEINARCQIWMTLSSRLYGSSSRRKRDIQMLSHIVNIMTTLRNFSCFFFPSLGQGRLLIDSACLFLVKVSIYQKSFVSASFVACSLVSPLGYGVNVLQWVVTENTETNICPISHLKYVISLLLQTMGTSNVPLTETQLPKLNWGLLHSAVFKDRRQLGTSTFIRTATDTRCEELNLWTKKIIQMQEHLYNISVFVRDHKMDWNI